MRALLVLIAALLAGCSTTLPQSATQTAPPPATSQPAATPLRVGLALGGGGAKGFAHVGVIRVLEAEGIKVDVVAGTSAGALVGALYASGMDSKTLALRAVELIAREIADPAFSLQGLLRGQRLQDYVNQQVGNRPLEAFPRRFAAVAVELDQGQLMLLGRGNAGVAVRASCSIPGIFEPVQVGQQRYVDGGVLSPVPVDAARQLGAQLVIAVDISSPQVPGQSSNAFEHLQQAVFIMSQRLARQELQRADLVIRPAVGQIGPAELDAREQAIRAGEAAARATIPALRRLLQERSKSISLK